MTTYPTNFSIPRTLPLTYDPAIYWLRPYVWAEQSVSMSVLEASYDWAWARAWEEVERGIAEALREVTWARYTTVNQPYHDDLTTGIRTFRRHAYEQPGFTYIHRYFAPMEMRRLRPQPQGGKPIDLEPRQLMYRGERVRGALHGTDLYVILPPPTTP